MMPYAEGIWMRLVLKGTGTRGEGGGKDLPLGPRYH